MERHYSLANNMRITLLPKIFIACHSFCLCSHAPARNHHLLSIVCSSLSSRWEIASYHIQSLRNVLSGYYCGKAHYSLPVPSLSECVCLSLSLISNKMACFVVCIKCSNFFLIYEKYINVFLVCLLKFDNNTYKVFLKNLYYPHL